MDGMRPMRYMGIADAAVKMGYDVTFFSSTFRHSNKTQRFSETTSVRVNDNYEVVYIKSPGYKSHISIKRLWAHYILGINLFRQVRKIENKPDIIIVAIPTLSSAYLITKWAKKNNIKVFADIIDPWPDSFYGLYKDWRKILLKLFLTPLSFVSIKILRNVTGVISISNEYCQWSLKKANRNHPTGVFYPLVNFDEIQLIQHKLKLNNYSSNNNTINVVYAGSFTISYDIPCILNAAQILEEKYNQNIIFHFAGRGFYQKDIEERLKNSSNIQYHGLLNFNQLQELFSICDIGLIEHFAMASQTVTYKLFDYLSADLVVINSLNSEMWDIIELNNIGLNHLSSDATELANSIETFYLNRDLLNSTKLNARKYCELNGNSQIGYTQLINFVDYER